MVAVVTGANRGIGLEVVRQLAARGDTAVLTARDGARAQAAAAGLHAAGHVLALQLDVADPGSVTRLAAELEQRFDRVDALVNNAAIHYDTRQRATSADLRVVHEALETNLFGAWRTAIALLGLLRRSAHPRIVNVSSGAGSLTTMGGGTPAYSGDRDDATFGARVCGYFPTK